MASHGNALISSIFSSIVKTSLSEKQPSDLKEKAPPTSGGTNSAKSMVPIEEKKKEEADEWVSVASKKKSVTHSKQPAASSAAADKTKQNASPATASSHAKPVASGFSGSNRFNALGLPFLTQKQLSNYEPGKPKNTKTALKNKRRNARRRAAKEAEKLELLLGHQTNIPVAAQATDATMSESVSESSSMAVELDVVQPEPLDKACLFLDLPYAVLTEGILSFLRPEDMAALGACNKYAKTITEEGFLWQKMFLQRFPQSELSPTAMKEWKRAYQLSLTKIVDRLRCFSTRKTFFEDVLGVGVAYTINPKTEQVDYIALSQDLISSTAFHQNKIRADVFGNTFEMFLPLYFSEEHFQRALPMLRKAIRRLASPRGPSRFARFEEMVLDVLPKVVNTFAVQLSDEGIAASNKSFSGLLRIHRLFLALAHEYPDIKRMASYRLRKFASSEKFRAKEASPSLGCILPLLMVVDAKDFSWTKLSAAYLEENFDRCVLWTCKKYPQLERLRDKAGAVESQKAGDERVRLTFDAMTVSLRLCMFHVYFYQATSRGTTTQERANRYDCFFGQPDPEDESPNSLSFSSFRSRIGQILSIDTWHALYAFLGVKCPPSKEVMAARLRQHVKNSARKKYHTQGMDFARVHASGTSKILAKGQQYSASTGLRRVVFNNIWAFTGSAKYLDATCLVYDHSKKLKETVDYSHTWGQDGAILHSGDVMREGGGTHAIQINLDQLDVAVASLVFVISAWADATLADILSPSVSFADADAEEEETLCTYDLDSQDKVSYLTSVVMCKLYRTKEGGWHVQAIGDAHKGAADNYGPIHKAVAKLL